MFSSYRLKNYKQEKKQFSKRVIKSAILIAILVAILVVRLFNLQILQYKLYTNLSEHNQLDLLPIEPNRGLIYDRNGVLLAENLPLFSLSIIPEQIKDIDATIDNLQTIIEITPTSIEQFHKIWKKHRRFEHVPLKIKLTQEEVAIFYLNQYRFPGVIVETQMIRHYPLDKTAASVLGYVGRINPQDLKSIDPANYDSSSNFIGKIGIEKYYENALRGKLGYKVAEVSATGSIARILKIIKPIAGDTLYLTIDSKLQKIAQDALDKERGAVVAIDPNNGEVLALVSHPGYDPNLFASGIDSATFNKLQSSSDKPMYNRATLGSYPLASTIKPFIALQGLDTGTVNPSFKISDPGWFKLPNTDHAYRDWIYQGHGIVNLSKAIIVSCDTYFYTLAFKLGIEQIDDLLARFGFSSKTKIDIMEENAGILASPKWKMTHKGKSWYTGDTIISSIGQGYMLATPLQLANGAAAIAMRGKRFQPHLLLTTKKHDGTIIKQDGVPLPPVILKNQNNWNIVIEAMQGVITDQSGTGYSRFGTNLAYTVAGKTGTAQLYHHKIINENPTPESEENIPKRLRNHHLFIAFAPVENPQIALAVITENSSTAPQVARKVLDYYLINKK